MVKINKRSGWDQDNLGGKIYMVMEFEYTMHVIKMSEFTSRFSGH